MLWGAERIVAASYAARLRGQHIGATNVGPVTSTTEASPHKRELKCDTKHQSQEADATFITSDGSKPYKPWKTLDTDNDNN